MGKSRHELVPLLLLRSPASLVVPLQGIQRGSKDSLHLFDDMFRDPLTIFRSTEMIWSADALAKAPLSYVQCYASRLFVFCQDDLIHGSIYPIYKVQFIVFLLSDNLFSGARCGCRVFSSQLCRSWRISREVQPCMRQAN